MILVVCKSLEGWKGGGREREKNYEEENGYPVVTF